MKGERRILCGEADTRALAAELVHRHGPGVVFALHGDLGAGKTRFAQGVASALGVRDLVGSPTFALVLEHPTASGGRFVHMDLYRLADEREAEDLGFSELLETAEATVIEWPDIAAALLPPHTIHVTLEATDPTDPDLRTALIEAPPAETSQESLTKSLPKNHPMRPALLLLFLSSLIACSPPPATKPTPIAMPWETEDTVPTTTPASISAVAQESSEKNCANVRSWCLYYGSATSEAMERLAGYELVVIDPAALGPKSVESIATLKQKGCLVAGYLSMIEIATWHRYRTRIPHDWIIQVDGTPWSPWGGKGVSWEGNLAASLAEPGWRAMLADLVKTEVLDFGCDGVFMDTLEDLDFASLPEPERERQLKGARLLMEDLDARYPKAFFIANRALQRALDAVGDHIDALCWESFAPKYFENPEARPWMDSVSAHIAQRRTTNPFRVLALWTDQKPGPDFSERQDVMRRIAIEHGYLPYCSTGSYSRLPPPAPKRLTPPTR